MHGFLKIYLLEYVAVAPVAQDVTLQKSACLFHFFFRSASMTYLLVNERYKTSITI